MPKGIPNKKTTVTQPTIAPAGTAGDSGAATLTETVGDLIAALLDKIGTALPTVKRDPYTASAKSIEITLQPLDGSARIRVLNTDRSMRSRRVEVAYPSGEADAGE